MRRVLLSLPLLASSTVHAAWSEPFDVAADQEIVDSAALAASQGRAVVAVGRNSAAANVNSVKARVRGRSGAWDDIVDLGVPTTVEQPVRDVLLRGERAVIVYGDAAVFHDLPSLASGGLAVTGFGPRVTWQASAGMEHVVVAYDGNVFEVNTDGVFIEQWRGADEELTRLALQNEPARAPVVVPLADGTAWVTLDADSGGVLLGRDDGALWSDLVHHNVGERTFFDAASATDALLATGDVFGADTALYVFNGDVIGPAIDTTALGTVVGGRLHAAGDVTLCFRNGDGLSVTRGAPDALPALTAVIARPPDVNALDLFGARCVVNDDGDVLGLLGLPGAATGLYARVMIDGVAQEEPHNVIGDALAEVDAVIDEVGNAHVLYLFGSRYLVTSRDSGVAPGGEGEGEGEGEGNEGEGEGGEGEGEGNEGEGEGPADGDDDSDGGCSAAAVASPPMALLALALGLVRRRRPRA